MELHISDLDGTLLNSGQKITKRSADIINGLIEKGMYFTVATARSIVSAQAFLKPLNLKLPLVLLNGIFIYDPVNKRNISENYLADDIAEKILDLYIKNDIFPLVYVVDNGGEHRIFYKGIYNEYQKAFIEERNKIGDRRFTPVKDYPGLKGMKVIHINTIGKKKELDRLNEALSTEKKISSHYYEDIYWEGYYLLETVDRGATKKSGVEFLKDYLKAERIICFGDNLNDLPMFEFADEKYAVSNAHRLLKEKADRIIGSNNEDGVALFLEQTRK